MRVGRGKDGEGGSVSSVKSGSRTKQVQSSMIWDQACECVDGYRQWYGGIERRWEDGLDRVRRIEDGNKKCLTWHRWLKIRKVNWGGC